MSLELPFYLDTPNPEATAEQYEAQRMVVDSSYDQVEQWTQLADMELGSQLPGLVQRERLGRDCYLGAGMLYDMNPQTSGT